MSSTLTHQAQENLWGHAFGFGSRYLFLWSLPKQVVVPELRDFCSAKNNGDDNIFPYLKLVLTDSDAHRPNK